MVKSPFRYPGGKTRLLDKGIGQAIQEQTGDATRFTDAFVGGGSVALYAVQTLGFRTLEINDLDPYMAAFWRVMNSVEQTKELASKVGQTHPTIEEFNALRAQEHADRVSDFDKAFHALYFNRTTFSGIRTGGAIGGPTQKIREAGDGDGKTYLVDCRWNASALEKKLLDISVLFASLDSVTVNELPAWELEDTGLMYCDPPYVQKGPQLYPEQMSIADHEKLRDYLLDRTNPWVLSYDDDDRVLEWYEGWKFLRIGAKYSIESKKWTGKHELLIIGEQTEESQDPTQQPGYWD
jgi:DNA adenine methylase